jgi:putative ATPase
VLEGAVALAEADGARDDEGRVAPALAHVEAAAQQRVLGYDRAGDGHYDTVSAFIKSLRGNDPDAAVYWLAAMVAAGEDPRFIARRLIISASEDVGNADPRALQVAVAAAQALDHVGLPEASTPCPAATFTRRRLGRTASPGLLGGRGRVAAQGSLPVPLHLRNAAVPAMKHHGMGVGYRYPHDFEGADVAQEYLPEALAERRYYRPTEEGYEAAIGVRMEARREARERAATTGGPQRRTERGPAVDPMRAAGSVMRTRETSRRALADTEKRDAGGE